jgi:hypothetical protein
MFFTLSIADSRLDSELFGHVEANFFLDDLAQRNIRGAGISDLSDEWPANRAASGVELSHAT